MEISECATYSYGSGATKKNLLIIAAILATIGVIIAASAISPFCLILLVLPVRLAVCIVRSKFDGALLLAGRYLILGDRIIYYRNVARATLDKSSRQLTIIPGKGEPLVITADRFPTNARKADKIENNKAAKFDKVAAKIISGLRENSPSIVIS